MYQPYQVNAAVADITSGTPTEPVTLAEAKAHLRIITGDTTDDAYITSRIVAARKLIEDRTNRTLVEKTLVLTQDDFYGDYVILPGTPLVSVTSVVTIDSDGTETTFGSSNYYIDTAIAPGRIYLGDTSTWPVDIRDHAGIKITYVAGTADTTQAITDLVLQLVAYYYFQGREGGDVADLQQLYSNIDTHYISEV